MTIEINILEEFKTAGESIQHVNASGRGVSILLNGRHLVVELAEAHRLEVAGVEFAYVCEHEMPSGEWRIVTIPVNSD